MEQFNSLKDDDRAEFVMKVIADRIGEGREFVRAGTGVLGRHMGSGCEVREDIRIEFEAGELVYSVDLKLGPIKGESQD